MLTCSISISQLFADHSSIIAVPVVITHCSPLVIDAHLHSTLILIGASNQTNISISTDATNVDYVIGNKQLCHSTEENSSNMTALTTVARYKSTLTSHSSIL